MKITVTTRRIYDQKKAEDLREYILKRINRVNRYINPDKDPSEVKFVLSVEKFRNSVELTLNSGNFKAASSVDSDSMHSAIDKSIDSIIKQLKKQTDKKIRTKRRKGLKTEPGLITDQLAESGVAGTIKIRKLPRKPMSLEEALLQLNASDRPFFAFTNSDTGAMNVLHKKKGGGIELITP